MQPDSILSRRIRPGILIWLTFIFTVAMFTDGNVSTLSIKEIYIKVLESILIVVYSAYFIAKSTENAFRIKKGNDKEEEDKDV